MAGTSDDADGNQRFALVRYDSSGTLDANFNGSGLVTTSLGDGYDVATGVTLDSQGRILVSGSSYLDGAGNTDTQNHFVLLRYNADGTLDGSFGTSVATGTATTDFSSLGFSTETSCGLIVDTDGGDRGRHGDGRRLQQFRRGLLRARRGGVEPVRRRRPALAARGPNKTVNEGQTLSCRRWARSPRVHAQLDKFSCQIDWGDGRTLPPAR